MLRRAILLALTIAAFTACGGDDVDITSASPSPEPSESPTTSLTITVDAGDGTAAQEWTLTCDPPGGSHPDTSAACAVLAGLDPTVFDPVDPNQMCTQIYGGPETATVRGTWDGEPLDASFARNNGCEIARWDAIKAMFGPAFGTAT